MSIPEAEVVETSMVRQSSPLARADELTIDQLLTQMQTIQTAMSKAMRDGEHYGVIPGTDKPTLLKPGAEKLCLLFRLGPRYRTEKTFDDDHLTVTAICSLTHIPTGNFVAEGEGMCSTKESKYAYRKAERACPQCHTHAIIKGKQEYGGGWICFKKKGGCGAKFSDGDEQIMAQQVGRVDNEDLADSYNTVLKMACKRALIAAVLNGTAASDIFTQDLEEMAGSGSPEPQAADWDRTPSSAASPPADTAVTEAVERFGQGVLLVTARRLAETNGIEAPKGVHEISPELLTLTVKQLATKEQV